MDGPRSTASADHPPAGGFTGKPAAASSGETAPPAAVPEQTPKEQSAAAPSSAGQSAPRQAEGESAGQAAAETANRGNRAGGLLRLAAVTAGIWWLGLLLLAAVTANPVTLNRAQILSSTAVVIGTVLDVEQGTVQVTQQFHGPALPEKITVERLKEAGAEQGQSYVIPVSGLPPSELQVEQSPLPGHPPLIYPATADAISQLTAFRTDNPDFQLRQIPEGRTPSRRPAADASAVPASPRQRFRPPIGPEAGPAIGPALPEN